MGKKENKRGKDIPCNYLAGEKSKRAEILFAAVKPHLSSLHGGLLNRDGGPGVEGTGPLHPNYGREISHPLLILDVTCGTSPLSDRIINHFSNVRYTGFDMNERAIELCRSRFPDHIWIGSLSNRFVIERHYDFVIHIGVSSPRYDVAEIHRRLIENSSGKLGLILIEWGDNREGTSDTRETFDAIRGIYIENGFYKVGGGEFDLGDIPYPVRRYEILGKTV